MIVLLHITDFFGGNMQGSKKKYTIPKDLYGQVHGTVCEGFDRFCENVLGTKVDELPSEESIFLRQSLSIVFCATILFLLTNGLYLVKNIVCKTMIVIDMIPLYMMVAASLAMLAFLVFRKNSGTPAKRFALLAFYTVVIASVTVFMVSCNYHGIGLSISMCYLFVIMTAPTYRALDTAIICLLISVSWWLPSVLPYADNYNLFKHFLLRFSIVAGFLAVRTVFLRQASSERYIKEMNNFFLKLAYNDMMTGTLNKKAMETYCGFVAEKKKPEIVGAVIFDIDNFKSYNDHYSHLSGDKALRRVAESTVKVLGKHDGYLFRFGGEEFLAILPNIGEEESLRIAKEFLEAVRNVAIPRDDLPEKKIVTASFGVACGTSEELADLSIIAKADKQLYISKNGGKDCVAADGIIYKSKEPSNV